MLWSLFLSLFGLFATGALAQTALPQAWWGPEYARAMLGVRDCLDAPHREQLDDWFKLLNETHWHTQLMAHALQELATQMHRPSTYCDAFRHALHNTHGWLRYQLLQEQFAQEQWGGKATLQYMGALRHGVKERCRRAGEQPVTETGRCMSLARKEAVQRLHAHRIG